MVSCLFSVAMGREGRCRQMSLACVGSTRSVPATLGFPLLTAHVLHCSGSRLLFRAWALSCVHFPGLSRSDSGFRVLHKSADSIGPVFCAFPAGAAQAARSLSGALSPGAVRLLFSAVPASVSGCAGRVRLVSLLGSWPIAATLPADVNHPESQEVFG